MKKILSLIFCSLLCVNIYAATSGMQLNDGTVSISSTGANPGLGDIKGFVASWTDADTISVSSGYAEVNGSVYINASATTHDISNFSNGKYSYIYIDDSASTNGGAPTIIDEDTDAAEPAWSDAWQGWYNGNDRCIGVVYCDGAATIAYFITQVVSSNSIRYSWATRLQIASSMSPDGTYQVPDEGESSTFLPVNAVICTFEMYNTDADTVVMFATPKEMSDVDATTYISQLYNIRGYVSADYINEMPLGASRNIRIGCADEDENNMSAWIKGYTTERWGIYENIKFIY